MILYKIKFRYSPMYKIQEIEKWLISVQKEGWKLRLILPNVYLFQKDVISTCDKIYFFTFSEIGGSDVRSGGKNKCMMHAEDEQLKNFFEGEKVISISKYTCFLIPQKYENHLETIKIHRSAVFQQYAKEKIVLDLFLSISLFVLLLNKLNQFLHIITCIILGVFFISDLIANIITVIKKR